MIPLFELMAELSSALAKVFIKIVQFTSQIEAVS